MTIPVQKIFSEWKKDPEFRRLAEESEPQIALIGALIDARRKARLTQTQIAERMGIAQSNVARLEAGQGNPTWATIFKYALASGLRPKLTFVADTKPARKAAKKAPKRAKRRAA